MDSDQIQRELNRLDRERRALQQRIRDIEAANSAAGRGVQDRSTTSYQGVNEVGQTTFFINGVGPRSPSMPAEPSPTNILSSPGSSGNAERLSESGGVVWIDGNESFSGSDTANRLGDEPTASRARGITVPANERLQNNIEMSPEVRRRLTARGESLAEFRSRAPTPYEPTPTRSFSENLDRMTDEMARGVEPVRRILSPLSQRMSEQVDQIDYALTEGRQNLVEQIERTQEDWINDLRLQDQREPLESIHEISLEAVAVGVGSSILTIGSDFLQLPELLSSLAESVPAIHEAAPIILQRFTNDERYRAAVYERLGDIDFSKLLPEIIRFYQQAREARAQGHFRAAQALYVRTAAEVVSYAPQIIGALRLVAASSSRVAQGVVNLAAVTESLRRGARQLEVILPDGALNPPYSSVVSRRDGIPNRHNSTPSRTPSATRSAAGRRLAALEDLIEQRRLNARRHIDAIKSQRPIDVDLRHRLLEARRQRRRSDEWPNLTRNERFREEVAISILEQPDHPLEFLINRTETSNFGKLLHPNQAPEFGYRRNQVISVEAGHVVDRTRMRPGQNERLALQDSGWNNRQRNQHPLPRRVIHIGGIPVELDTAILWRELGLIDESIVNRAISAGGRPGRRMPIHPASDR